MLELGAAARLTPPPGWATGHHPAMLSTWRDGTSGRRVVEVLTATGERIASTTVPWRPADELVAEYAEDGLLQARPDR